MIEISVVIPTHNRKELLEKCLFSLGNQDYDKNGYEIIVVDDGGTDGTEEMMSELIKTSLVSLIYLRQKHNGQARARNLGVRYAQSSLIAFTDDDCKVDKNWIGNILDCFNRSHEIDARAGKIAGDPSFGSIQKDGDGFFSDLTSPACPGTGNFAIRKRVFLEIGGFDERLFCNEDNDLFIRLLKTGHKIYVDDQKELYHKPIVTIKDIFRRNYEYGSWDPVVFKKNFKDQFIFKIGDKILWDVPFFCPIYINLDLFNSLVTTPFYWLSLENKSLPQILHAYSSSLGRILGNLVGSIKNRILFYGP